MEYLKDIFNFKENKRYKITIIILSVIIVLLQTRVSFSNKKIQYLNAKLNRNTIENSNSSKEIESNISDFIDTDDSNKNELEIDDNFQEEKEILIEKYKDIAKENNKEYSPNIKNGKKVLVFETISLNMTDGQIKKSLEKISSDRFGIEIEREQIRRETYYKIYLLEQSK